ncbi:hypothetical protein MPER_02143 [Moniliophthora perniciosa FA553]|nr:hypothetical protein MPER_02143 [Moniliophthora perniciosa FA553]
MDGWIELIEEMYHLAFESGLVAEDDARIFWNLVTGFHSDHAEDQKKLFRLLKEWKEQCDRELRGERAERRMNELEHVIFILRCSQEAVSQIGGPIVWDALSPEERSRRIEESRRKLIQEIGQAEFDRLSEEEKKDIDFFLWAGCCMHKEMNAFKGGCTGMDQFWTEHPELAGPKKIVQPRQCGGC